MKRHTKYDKVIMERRTTIRLNDETVGILEQAKRVWPEHAESQSAMIRAVVSDWWRSRQDVGGKTDLLYALLYMAMKDGDVTVDEAKEGAAFVRNAWKGEVRP